MAVNGGSALEQQGEHRNPEGPVLDVQSRFIYSFLVPRGFVIDGIGSLLNFRHCHRQVWSISKPKRAYTQELLEPAKFFLFGAGEASCHYLTISDAICDSWFRRGCKIIYGNREQSLIAFIEEAKIELFLHSDGAGVLCLRLKPSLRAAQWNGSSVKLFNYRTAQLREGTAPSIMIPHPAMDPEKRTKINSDTPEAPPPDSHISERIGSLGGTFSIQEIIGYSLSSLEDYHICSVDTQLSVYTVIRLSEEISFTDEMTLKALGPLIAGLSQVEEPLHAGDVPGRLAARNIVVNTRHWSAVSSLGAAHLIADQPAQGSSTFFPYNEQRMSTVIDKYFMAYLLAHLQRLHIHAALVQAQELVQHFRRNQERGRKEGHTRLSRLRKTLIEFSVFADLVLVSGRESVNRFYDLCREGLRVTESLDSLKAAISDFGLEHDSQYAQELSERLGHNIDTVASVQSKLEWLEVFIGSFYATELVNMVAEAGNFEERYRSISVPLWAIFSAVVIAFSLRPWEHGNEKRRRSTRLVMWVVGLAILALAVWIVLGHTYRRQSTGPEGHKQSEVDRQPSSPNAPAPKGSDSLDTTPY
jgi:hypothetical protein